MDLDLESAEILEQESQDAISDPRSKSVREIYDAAGTYQRNLVKEFLREKICACWKLNSIAPFLALVKGDNQCGKWIEHTLNYYKLSVKNLTVLWRVAQRWDVDTARVRLGQIFSRLLLEMEQCDESLLDEAFDQLSHEIESERTSADVTEIPNNAAKTLPISANSDFSVLDATAQPNTTIQETLNTQDNIFAPSHLTSAKGLESPSITGAERDNVSAPPNLEIHLGISTLFRDEFPDQSAEDSLLWLDIRVLKATIKRHQWILRRLKIASIKKEEELGSLAKEEAQSQQANRAIMLLKELEDDCGLIFEQGEAPGGASSMLKNLREQALAKHNISSRDVQRRKSLLQQEHERIVAKSDALKKELKYFERLYWYHERRRTGNPPTSPQPKDGEPRTQQHGQG